MTVRHYTAVSGDSWYGIGRRLLGVAVTVPNELDKFVRYLAMANGTTISAAIFEGRILHYDDARIPMVVDPTPPPPPPPPPPVVTPPVTPPPAPPGQFYVKNGRIGRGGFQWVPIGLNGATRPKSAPAGDWWNDSGMGVMNGRSKLFVEMGFNFVRFNEMRDYNTYSFDDYQAGLFEAMDEYLAAGITVMPAYHSMGPGQNPSPATIAGDATWKLFWQQIVERYKANPNVIINPLNEPTGSVWDTWEATAQAQYDYIRGLGWKGLIVIDLPQWAQGISVAVNRAPGWIKARTDGQVVMGFHNYAMGDATAAVRAAQALGVAIMIGECGATLGEVNTPSYQWCVDNAHALGVGCVFWWGAGNRNDDYVMRMRRGATFYDTTVGLSPAGQKLIGLTLVKPAPVPL